MDNQELTKLLLELSKIERSFLKVFYENDIEISSRELIRMAFDAFDIFAKIKRETREKSIIQVRSREACDIFKKLREEELLYCLRYHKYIVELYNKDRPYDEQLPADFDDIFEGEDLLDEFLSEYNYVYYHQAVARVGAIISFSSSIPSGVDMYFEEIKRCYGLGLYIPCIALCRSLIEMCIKAKLEAKEGRRSIQRADGVSELDDFKKDYLYSMIRHAKRKKILDQKTAEEAHSIRIDANNILHPRKEPTSILGKDTLRIIAKTVNVIEFIFRR